MKKSVFRGATGVLRGCRAENRRTGICQGEKDMAFSEFLESKREAVKKLVNELSDSFSYVSVLGTDVRMTLCTADFRSSSVRDGAGECGFVVKMWKGGAYFEYSLDDITGDIRALADKIAAEVKTAKELDGRQISPEEPLDEPLKDSFARQTDFDEFGDKDLLDFCVKIKDEIKRRSDKVVNAIGYVQPFSVSKLFVSKNRELDQSYGWVNAMAIAVYKDGKTVRAREDAYSTKIAEVFEALPAKLDKLIDKAKHLVKAEPIKPGIYDVITDSSISGLIAHEAFGHGVEMDQFVKDRALAKEYVGKYVASPVCNMKDGAAATLSAASYFFDDDGVLAGDTQIIENGILVSGMCDLVSASELNVIPTGNGRRESYKRKAYTRMTNTFFEAGSDKLEDMIASVKHGYMLFETNNGMEDPKNWQIQCTAEYGIEIIDGKLTENYVSPVVMSGSVPELLKSITMVSDGLSVIGAGQCGKGYKEWVRVSDGGPALKVRCKLA